jgi:hypothetical protein
MPGSVCLTYKGQQSCGMRRAHKEHYSINVRIQIVMVPTSTLTRPKPEYYKPSISLVGTSAGLVFVAIRKSNMPDRK